MIRKMTIMEFFFFQYGGFVKVFSPGVYYLALVFLYPSILSVGLIIVGAITGIVFSLALLAFEDNKRLQQAISGFLKPFSRCDFRRFDISDYVENDLAKDMVATNIPFHTTWGTFRMNLKLNRNTKIYAVKRGSSIIVPYQLVTFEYFGGDLPSMVFIRDDPDEVSPLGRFLLLHEIGHTNWRNADQRMTSLLGWKLFVLPVILMIISIKPSAISYGVVAVYVLLLIITYPIYNQWLTNARFIEELSADRFAIHFLSTESRHLLLNYLTKAGHLPKDPLVCDLDNVARSDILKSEINKQKDSTIVNDHIEYLSHVPINRLIGVFALLITFIGVLNRPPSTFLLFSNVIILILSIIFLVLVHIYQTRCVEEIQEYISGDFCSTV